MDPALIAQAIAAIASTFGGKKKGTGIPEQRREGYAALPPQGQSAYNNYFNLLNNLEQNPYATNRMSGVRSPSNIFDSQEFYNLQQTQPGQGVRPIGVLEPFNQVQQQALSSYANPDYSDVGLANYMKPFENIKNRVLENINRNANIGFSGIKGREARIGSLARDPLYGGQLPQLEEARARALADAETNFSLNALGLRQQSLADMLNAGNLIQKQNQAGLESANGLNLTRANPLYGQLSAILSLLSGIPNSGTTTGAIAEQPSNIRRLGGAGLSLFGNQFGGQFT